jgi:hypothetical protein
MRFGNIASTLDERPIAVPTCLLESGDVIARNSCAFESTAPLEFGERIITPEEIDQVPWVPFLADFDRLGDQGIVCRFVAML